MARNQTQFCLILKKLIDHRCYTCHNECAAFPQASILCITVEWTNHLAAWRQLISYCSGMVGIRENRVSHRDGHGPDLFPSAITDISAHRWRCRRPLSPFTHHVPLRYAQWNCRQLYCCVCLAEPVAGLAHLCCQPDLRICGSIFLSGLSIGCPTNHTTGTDEQ